MLHAYRVEQREADRCVCVVSLEYTVYYTVLYILCFMCVCAGSLYSSICGEVMICCWTETFPRVIISSLLRSKHLSRYSVFDVFALKATLDATETSRASKPTETPLYHFLFFKLENNHWWQWWNNRICKTDFQHTSERKKHQTSSSEIQNLDICQYSFWMSAWPDNSFFQLEEKANITRWSQMTFSAD